MGRACPPWFDKLTTEQEGNIATAPAILVLRLSKDGRARQPWFDGLTTGLGRARDLVSFRAAYSPLS